MSDPRESITSVSDAIEKLRKLERDDPIRDPDEWPFHKFPFGIWFRGHSTAGLELKPQVFRDYLPPREQVILPFISRCDGNGSWDETNVYEHLKLRVPIHEHTYHTAFDWLCLMQHYSVPTRLLDWSESILHALYFAVKERGDDDDGELFALNAHRLNSRTKRRPTISTPEDYHVVIRAEMATTRSSRTLVSRHA